MKVEAVFVTSAASSSGLPHDGLPGIALVGRSNVGKSSLVNALMRQRLARTSAAPGKTRLANVYRVTRGGGTPFYLVDLPGYGYARGGRQARRASSSTGDIGAEGFEQLASGVLDRTDAALLLVDARHPGLQSDLEAWRWLRATVEHVAVVGTKIDKLARGERIRAMRELESVLEQAVLPVSADSGEGLDELWKLIDRLANSRRRNPHSRKAATAPPLPRR